MIVSVILLGAVRAVPAVLAAQGRRTSDRRAAGADHEPPRWPMWLAVGAAGRGGAAGGVRLRLVRRRPSSRPWTRSAISEAFAGLVIVAIAGNAIENVVGIQLAAKDQSEYAFSVVLNSPIQIALVLAPVLVIVARSSGWRR